MTDYLAAAQALIVNLNAPAQAHSVWIRTEVDDNGQATGERALCVSIRPGWKSKIKIPSECRGVPVVEVPWPKGS